MDEASSLTLRSWVKQGGSLTPTLSARLAGNDQTRFTEDGARWVVPLLMERVDALS